MLYTRLLTINDTLINQRKWIISNILFIIILILIQFLFVCEYYDYNFKKYFCKPKIYIPGQNLAITEPGYQVNLLQRIIVKDKFSIMKSLFIKQMNIFFNEDSSPYVMNGLAIALIGDSNNNLAYSNIFYEIDAIHIIQPRNYGLYQILKKEMNNIRLKENITSYIESLSYAITEYPNGSFACILNIHFQQIKDLGLINPIGLTIDSCPHNNYTKFIESYIHVDIPLIIMNIPFMCSNCYNNWSFTINSMIKIITLTSSLLTLFNVILGYFLKKELNLMTDSFTEHVLLNRIQ